MHAWMEAKAEALNQSSNYSLTRDNKTQTDDVMHEKLHCVGITSRGIVPIAAFLYFTLCELHDSRLRLSLHEFRKNGSSTMKKIISLFELLPASKRKVVKHSRFICCGWNCFGVDSEPRAPRPTRQWDEAEKKGQKGLRSPSAAYFTTGYLSIAHNAELTVSYG